jgi:hypothetical protein
MSNMMLMSPLRSRDHVFVLNEVTLNMRRFETDVKIGWVRRDFVSVTVWIRTVCTVLLDDPGQLSLDP